MNNDKRKELIRQQKKYIRRKKLKSYYHSIQYVVMKLRFLILAIGVLIVFPVSTYLLTNTTIGLNIRNNDWIGFYGSFFGSLIGGVFTLVGLYLTIKHTSKITQLQIREQHRPYMDVTVDFNNYTKSYEYSANNIVFECCKKNRKSNEKDKLCKQYECPHVDYQKNLREYSMEVEIKNIGRGIAIDIFYLYDRAYFADISNAYGGKIKYGILSTNESMKVIIDFQLPPIEMLEKLYSDRPIPFELIYKDISGHYFLLEIFFSYIYQLDSREKYVYTLEYSHHVNIDISEDLIKVLRWNHELDDHYDYDYY